MRVSNTFEYWDEWYAGDEGFDQAYVRLELEPLPDDFEVFCSTCAVSEQTRMPVSRCCNREHTDEKEKDIEKAKQDHFELVKSRYEEELRGCAIVDSGATSGVVSVHLFDEVQDDYLKNGTRFCDSAVQANRTFTVANGEHGTIKYQTKIKPIEESPFQGRTYNVCVDANKPDTNRTPFLVGSDFLKANKCIVDFDLGVMIYKDDPETVHHLKVHPNGHTLLMPLTKDQCGSYYYQTKLSKSHDDVFKTVVSQLNPPVNRGVH